MTMKAMLRLSVGALLLLLALPTAARANPAMQSDPNNAPLAVDDQATTSEATSITIDVLSNDSDSDGDPLVVDSLTPPSNGTTVINPDNTVTYTPNANFNGADSFTYTISDGNGGSATATVNVTINAVNEAPLAVDDQATTSEATPVIVDVLSNDSDGDGDPLTVDSVTAPANGSAAVNADNTVTYTPNVGFVGSDTFTYTATDGEAATLATVFVNVNGSIIDQFLIAYGDTISDGVPGAGAGNIEVAGAMDVYTFQGNAGDEVIFDAMVGSTGQFWRTLEAPDGTVIFDTFYVDQQVSLAQTGPYTLTLRGFNIATSTGTYSFRLLLVPAPQAFTIALGDTVSDGVPDPGAGNLEAPGARDIYRFDAIAGQEMIFDALAGNTGQFWRTLEAPDGTVVFDGFYVDQQVSLPQTGTYTLTLRGYSEVSTGVYSFQLLLIATTQEFTIALGDTVSDGVPDSGAGNIEAPGAVDIYRFDALATQGAIFDALIGDTGQFRWALTAPDGTSLFDSIYVDHQVNLPQTGTYMLTVTGLQVTSFGTYSFALLEGVSNSNPVAADDSATTDEDTPITIDVLSNDSDVDGDTLVVDSLTPPANGSATINPDNTVTYTPNASFNGADSLTYTISDGNGGSATATVNVTINPVNDNPVAADDSATTDEDTPVTIDVLSNDSDVDGDTLVVDTLTPPANGSATINPDNTVTYTPALNFNGGINFTYTVSDGNGRSATATVNVTINPVNDNPAAADDSATTDEDTPVTIDVLSNDSDVDGDTLVVDTLTPPANGSATVNPDNTVTYTPALNFNGGINFTYTVSDGNGGSASATVTVEINSSGAGIVQIDILPFFWLNIVNLNSAGVLPVAILSDSGFDAASVSVDSVTLAGASTVPPVPGWPKFIQLDVNRDRRRDIIVYFNIQDLALTPGMTEATLFGETLSGVGFTGTDRVYVVPLMAPHLLDPRDGETVYTDRPVFHWYPVALDTCYRIQINDAPFSAVEQPFLQEATVTLPRNTATHLPDGVYYWRVRVGGTCGVSDGPWSAQRSFTIQTND